MADYWTPYLAGALEPDVAAGAVYFCPTEADAQALADAMDAATNSPNAYDVYEIADADVTGAGTLEDVPDYPGFKYRDNTGSNANIAASGCRIAFVQFVFDESGASSSGSESLDASLADGTSNSANSSEPFVPFMP